MFKYYLQIYIYLSTVFYLFLINKNLNSNIIRIKKKTISIMGIIDSDRITVVEKTLHCKGIESVKFLDLIWLLQKLH